MYNSIRNKCNFTSTLCAHLNMFFLSISSTRKVMNAKFIFNKELIERYFTILFYWNDRGDEKKKENLVSVTLFYGKDKILSEYTNLFLLPTKVMHKSYKSSFGICFSLFFYVFAHIFHCGVCRYNWNGGNRESFSIALYLNAMRNKFKCVQCK